MKNKHVKTKKLSSAMSKFRSVLLLGSFVFLPGGPVRGENQLLKEYIYLDGRLLAIEYQSVNVIVQQPAPEEKPDLRAEASVDGPLLSLIDDGFPVAPPAESAMDEAAARRSRGAEITEIFAAGQSPVGGGDSND